MRSGLTAWCCAAMVVGAPVALVPGFARAAAPLVLEDIRDQSQVGLYLEYLEDRAGRLSIDDILRGSESESWTQNTTDVPSFGITDSPYWIRINVSYTTGAAKKWLLEIGNPLFRSVDVYIVSDGVKTAEFRTGISHPFEQRPMGHRNFVFPLDAHRIESGQFVVYARLHSPGDALQAPVIIWDGQAFFRDQPRANVLRGLYYGLMLIMALYNLVIFVGLREKSYLYYAWFVTAVVLMQTILDGTCYQFLWPDDVPWIAGVVPGVGLFTILAGLFFTRIYLDIARRSAAIERVFDGLSVLVGLTLLSSVALSYRYLILAMSALAVPAVGTMLVAGMATVGTAAGRYYVLAWTSFLVGTLLKTLTVWALIPTNALTANGLLIGSALLVVLLSFGLAARLNREIRDKEEAQQRALLVEREAADNLQEQVDERTKSLDLKRVEAQEAGLEALAAKEDAEALHFEAEARTKRIKELYDQLEEESNAKLQVAKDLLVQSAKLAELGRLVAGIGHDMSTPTSTISMSVELLEGKIERHAEALLSLLNKSKGAEKAAHRFRGQFDDIRELIGSARISANRLANLCEGLRRQARSDAEVEGGIEVEEVIEECIAITKARMRGLDVETQFASALPAVAGKRSQIGQVVTNLLANAGDALAEKVERVRSQGGEFSGKVLISLEARQREEQEGLLIAVSDNGDGVPDDLKGQVFEEFFTTKGVGAGTGLGLPLCADIIRDHGGTLSVSDDAALGGARFEIWLPLQPPEPEVTQD